MADPSTEPGGFLLPSLPSPAPSNVSVGSTSSNLPQPRSHPLKAGSAKEEAARRYVEGRLLHISRRYVKKFQSPDDGEAEDVKGYVSMVEVSKDLGEVVDVLWLSGTRESGYGDLLFHIGTKSEVVASLQVPYLLNVALSVTSYLPAFPAAPKATFALIRKLDHAFSSLLRGEDTVTGEILPGFKGGKKAGMSRTDMVRCKSLVESTRVMVVEVMGKETEDEHEGDESGAETDATDVDMESAWDPAEDKHNMDVARVYEGTILALGEHLESQTNYDVGSGQS